MTLPGYIPVLYVKAENLPQAWELAILKTWEEGISIRTEYDRQDEQGQFIDPPSRDATLVIEVADPLSEPRIHKNFPGGLEELEVYRQEVVAGIHDHWIDSSDPLKWTYTYHQRLFAYQPSEDLHDPDSSKLKLVNQIENIINQAACAGHSRRLQATTWIPNADPAGEHPPCLQRIWMRVAQDNTGTPVLNLNTHWRSRDGYKAWFMNVFALTDLQRKLAQQLSEKLGQDVKVGRYVDISDSFHIYGSDFADVEREVGRMKADPDYHKRAWRSDDPMVQVIFEETRQKLAADPDYMKSR